MRSTFAAAALAACAFALTACTGTPVQRVDVPPPSDQNAYQLPANGQAVAAGGV